MGKVYSDMGTKDSAVIEKEKEYGQYIANHIANVKNAYRTLFFENGHVKFYTISEEIGSRLYEESVIEASAVIENHDASKFSDDEFDYYRMKFYPTDEEKQKIAEDAEYAEYVYDAFQFAWRHHYMNNDHHPMFWCYDYEIGNELEVPRDMTIIAIIHMICDWCAMNYYQTGSYDCTDWYNTKADEEKKSMSAKTKHLVDELLRNIFNKEVI